MGGIWCEYLFLHSQAKKYLINVIEISVGDCFSFQPKKAFHLQAKGCADTVQNSVEGNIYQS